MPIRKTKGTKVPKASSLLTKLSYVEAEVGDEDVEGNVTNPIRYLKKKGNETWEVVKFIYPRVAVSWDDLQQTVENRDGKQKMLVVEIFGVKSLDFDIPEEMGIEFVGKGIDESILSVVGNLKNLGRASFLNMTVTFRYGSLHTMGPTFFKSSRIVDINRCPYSFTEYNDRCFLVSDFIEQSDDAASFCESFD